MYIYITPAQFVKEVHAYNTQIHTYIYAYTYANQI